MVSPINPSSIPPITALREELDYGDPQLLRCQAFQDSVRIFRKTFVSSQGWDGTSILDWKSREHQIALGEMVRSYLEQHKNGRLFWPDDKSQSRANRFQYSTDSARIKIIMRQLFWRLNIQQFRNSKYRGKDKAGRAGAKRGRGPSEELGVETDIGGAASTSRDAAGTPDTPRSSTFINLTDSPFAVQTDVVNPASREAQSHSPTERTVNEDLYRVPDSPDPRILRPQNQPTFAVMSTGIDGDGRQVAPVANMEPPAKRSRGDGGASKRMSSKRVGKQPAGLGKSRISPRKRKLRNVTGRATDDEIQEALQSLERIPSPEVVENPTPAETNNAVTSDIVLLWNRERENPFRATVSEVTDEEISVNGFVRQLGAEARPHSPGPSNSATHAGPFAQPPPPEATPQPSVEVKPDTRPTSPIPLTSSSVPPEAGPVVDDMPPVNQTTPQAPPSVKQARVEFTYCVVCRYPERQSLSWKPEGSFRNKTLSKLEEELPLHLEWSQFQYLHFRLTAPNTRAEHVVCRGREDQFDMLKRRLAALIRDCIADTPCGKTILVGIDIEPLSDENALRKSRDSEVMDFEW